MYWQYVALNNFGKEVAGSFHGTRKDARALMQDQGWIVIKLFPEWDVFWKELFYRQKIDHKILADMLKNLAGMLEVGLSMNEILENLTETTGHNSVRMALARMRNDLNKGYLLWEAMKRCGAFGPMAISCVSAGEESGNLPEVLRSLASTFEFTDEVKKKIWGAVAYPLGLCGLISAASVIISVKLVPALRDFLPAASMDKMSVKLFLWYCHLVQYHWYVFAVVPLIAVMFFWYWHRFHADIFFKCLYKIPVLGPLVKEMQLSLYFLNLYTYQKSGITIKDSIGYIHAHQSNYISRMFLKCLNGIDHGLCFWEAVKQEQEIPKVVYQNIRRGEIQGKYEEYFRHIHGYFKTRTEEATRTLIPILQPAFILIGGVMIMFLIGTFIVPIYTNLNSMMNGMF
ncbi:MAG: type II secretion system F family protein [Candidatus Omnitrophica bacterium]|nr:type II secretion system F family protein [Candidatus Omnitrophota bacterium]